MLLIHPIQTSAKITQKKYTKQPVVARIFNQKANVVIKVLQKLLYTVMSDRLGRRRQF